MLGDMVADEYILGRPARISREAPVLILHFAQSFVRPGGATNPACNLHRLGARTTVVGVVGDDEPGRSLRAALETVGLDTSCMLVDTSRPTSTATRIVARGTQEVQQQIVRIDRIEDRPLDASLRSRMIDAALARLSSMDALLFSDYEHGVISSEVIDACLRAARGRAMLVTVDAHGDLFRFRGVTAATPNQPEAAGTLHRVIRTEADLDAAGAALLTGMEARGVLITRGSEGLVLYESGLAPYKLPVSTPADGDVVDPTGAGDTVAATFTLALACGATMRQAAYISNVAGGEVVRHLGAATLTRADLRRALQRTHLPPP